MWNFMNPVTQAQTHGVRGSLLLVMLLVTVLSFGFLSPIMVTIGIVEGIVYLTRSDQMFLQDYVVNKRSWF